MPHLLFMRQPVLSGTRYLTSSFPATLLLALLMMFLLSCGWCSRVHSASEPGVETVDFSGSWRNQRGSVLRLVQNSNGRLQGSFTTAVANTPGCIGYGAPATGSVNGNSLTLSVDMTGCQSPTVIAMTGLYSSRNGTLKTEALTQIRGEDNWNSQILTTDFYQRIAD